MKNNQQQPSKKGQGSQNRSEDTGRRDQSERQERSSSRGMDEGSSRSSGSKSNSR